MRIRDRSGYAVFSEGEVGAAHVMAHTLLDSGQIELGHHRLGRWLARRAGSGSDWAHIHFHMAVFELEVGDWRAAHERFLDELLPIAVTSDDALTDAPALAWRLKLRAGRRAAVPFELLRETALRSLRRPHEMQRPNDPFVELHNLLALAGAGDADGIRAWLDACGHDAPSGKSGVLVRMAEGLSACTQKHYRRAAGILKSAVAELPSIGGSRAQNALFTELQARMAVA